MVWRRMLGREELTPVEARQGFLDRPVLVVLIASVAMVSILFGLLLIAVALFGEVPRKVFTGAAVPRHTRRRVVSRRDGLRGVPGARRIEGARTA